MSYLEHEARSLFRNDVNEKHLISEFDFKTNKLKCLLVEFDGDEMNIKITMTINDEDHIRHAIHFNDALGKIKELLVIKYKKFKNYFHYRYFIDQVELCYFDDIYTAMGLRTKVITHRCEFEYARYQQNSSCKRGDVNIGEYQKIIDAETGDVIDVTYATLSNIPLFNIRNQLVCVTEKSVEEIMVIIEKHFKLNDKQREHLIEKYKQGNSTEIDKKYYCVLDKVINILNRSLPIEIDCATNNERRYNKWKEHSPPDVLDIYNQLIGI